MSRTKLAIKWALIYIAISLLWMVFEKVVGLHDEHIDLHMYMTNVFFIFALVVFVLALYDAKRRLHGGRMTWGQGFVFGLIVTAIITVIAPVSQYVISTYITPDYFDTVSAYAVETGYAPSMEAAREQFNLNSYMLMNTMGSLIMGVVFSAVAALFAKGGRRVA